MRRSWCLLILLILLVLLGGYFRASGLFRGLDRGVLYHPDAPKQVMMLDNYLHGNYVQYFDSLFYDGYPYGLNRVDELLIRVGYGALRPVRARLSPGTAVPPIPPRAEILLWARWLRVVYGLLAVGFIYASVRRFGAGPRAAVLGASLYALAPLAATVTHSVTGDVGVDLFLAIGAWTVARYAHAERPQWLVLAGLACGVAFACKYQGAFGLWMPAVAVLLASRWSSGVAVRLVRKGGLTLLGFIAGACLANPALVIVPDRTWKFMRLNFAFVRDYGAPQELLDLPPVGRLIHGITINLHQAVGWLGWGTLALTLVALTYLVKSRFEAGKANAEDMPPPSQRWSRWAAATAVVTFPLVALLLSTVLKPVVQPFHFSFVLPGLAIAGGVALAQRADRFGRGLLVVLAVAAVVEGVAGSLKEDFFWRRPDITGRGDDYVQDVVVEGAASSRSIRGSRMIKHLYLEPAVLPVFRNRPSGIEHVDHAWWNQNRRLPVPSIPGPDLGGWVFCNGPVFPRNDRMFVIPASGPGFVSRLDQALPEDPLLVEQTRSRQGRWHERVLVFEEVQPPLRLGLRTGRWPARFEIEVPGDGVELMLAPQSQHIVGLALPDAVQRVEVMGEQRAVSLVPLRVRSQLGPLWVTVLETDEDLHAFQRFGPDQLVAEGAAVSTEEAAARLKGLRYLGDNQPLVLSQAPQRLSGATAPLAAGAYRMEARIHNEGRPTTVQFDFAYDPSRALTHNVEVPAGIHDITWRFTKPFAPYDGVLRAAADTGGPVLESWTLLPDPVGLETARLDSVKAAVEWGQETKLDVKFPGIGDVEAFVCPAAARADAPFDYGVRFRLNPEIAHKVFHEAAFFLHVKDGSGNTIVGLDFPLRDAMTSDGKVLRQSGRLAGCRPGQYRIDGGLYNARTRERYEFKRRRSTAPNMKRRYFRFGEVTVE